MVWRGIPNRLVPSPSFRLRQLNWSQQETGFQFFDRVEVFLLPTAGGRVRPFFFSRVRRSAFQSNSFRQIMSSDFGPWFVLAIRRSSSDKELNSLRFHADFGSNHFFGRALKSVETQESAKKIDFGVLNIVVWSVWGFTSAVNKSPASWSAAGGPTTVAASMRIRCSDQMQTRSVSICALERGLALRSRG